MRDSEPLLHVDWMVMRRAFILDLVVEGRAAEDLSAGGVFIPNASVEFDDECQIILRAGGEDMTVEARAVQILDTGAGFQIEGITPELRLRIAALVELAKHASLDLERKKTLTRSLAGEAGRRPAGSIPPSTRRSSARVAEGSISPILAFAPTQQGAPLADKARSAQQRAARADTVNPDTDTDD
ncbi:MAG TPA: hypothetical protein VL326_27220 [Kofleriaceae bacterium]|nr:hypothetical protein [Kofleriaceae bacterium]